VSVPAATGDNVPAFMPTTWVIVAGGAHDGGGMERANAALLRYLITMGATVHLVTHEAAPDLVESPRVELHRVRRVPGLAATDYLLDRTGRRVARTVCRRSPGACVVVNGGNCTWPDVNWVHYVHHAWKRPSRGRLPIRARRGVLNAVYRRSERRALTAARLVIVNSEVTRRDVVRHVGIAAERVRLVYLGAESAWAAPTSDERSRARTAFGAGADERVIAFVGGLGHDERKGFDVLLAAWRVLAADPQFHGRLLVAGTGARLPSYAAAAASMSGRNPIVFLGHTPNVRKVLAAADLTVSPSRYESYGLNVQESFLCGVPALVTRGSGVAERYPACLEPLLLDNPGDAGELVIAVRRWESNREELGRAALELGDRLRAHTWADMGREFVAAVVDSRTRDSAAAGRSGKAVVAAPVDGTVAAR